MHNFSDLQKLLTGKLFYNNSAEHKARRIAYSTDASVYQELPLAVAIPEHVDDIVQLILFAKNNSLTLIPRAAGTSLAGQVVGNGIVIDISVHFNQILELNTTENWVRVQPGIIRDDLNAYLKPYGLMYSPETSTANRAMIGGMIGNNSCGLHSIVWGDARSHLLEATVLLHDGTSATFNASGISNAQSLTEANIYGSITDIICNEQYASIIQNNYPKPSLTRRNTGYALDLLLKEYHLSGNINLCKILAGSEGTLAFITEAKLNLIPLPPPVHAVVCIHCTSIIEAMHVNNIALLHQPMASELVDKFIMDFTIGHPTYEETRFFIQGDPQAVLMVEFMKETEAAMLQKTAALVQDLQSKKLGYAWPVITGADTKKVWDVRKAGLGLIRNKPGNVQPVNLIEDCAVSPQDLPAYVEGVQGILSKHGLQASFYAHAGAGELHIEPMINLKEHSGRQTFRAVLAETVQLVKQFNGSLSGEHGDGRLRGEFIPEAMGIEVYSLLEKVKHIFDPHGVFNAGKITATPPMDTMLRYSAQDAPMPLKTYFDFSGQESMLRLAEKCSGSGDCRRSHVSGGTMCPSYMATRQEKDTTRARANLLRQFMTQSTKQNPLNHPEIKEVMDLCLSCKACKSECPSEVDVAKLKAEFLQHYYDANGTPFRAKIISEFAQLQRMALWMPSLYNAFATNKITSAFIKKVIGFAAHRSLPTVDKQSLFSWYTQHKRKANIVRKKKVHLFCDEFTNYNDVTIGQKTILLLEALGYEVIIPKHVESGRASLSKGLLKKAAVYINKNLEYLKDVITEDAPLIGIEPSAILTFRDEAPDLALPPHKEFAQFLKRNSFQLEEFLWREIQHGEIEKNAFSNSSQHILLHGHCFQKAYHLMDAVVGVLSFPENYQVQVIPSGCCGMAGSFGFEKEHFEVSMKVGELVLLPAVRQARHDTIIAAAGTSCRHQIKDGAARKAVHPAEVLYDALVIK